MLATAPAATARLPLGTEFWIYPIQPVLKQNPCPTQGRKAKNRQYFVHIIIFRLR
jgi:hypothetical protein